MDPFCAPTDSNFPKSARRHTGTGTVSFSHTFQLPRSVRSTPDVCLSVSAGKQADAAAAREMDERRVALRYLLVQRGNHHYDEREEV